MKKNTFLLAFAVSALSIGCSLKEDMAPNTSETEKVHVTAVAGIVETKVSLGDGTEKITATWTEGETFSVLEGTASVAPVPFTQKGDISADGKSASFEGDLSGTAADCYAFSPALDESDLTNGGAAATAIPFNMTGQSGGLKGVKMYMWAKGTYTAGEPINFAFKQLASILKVNMTFPAGVEDSKAKITFVADEGLVVRANVNITGDNAEVVPQVYGNIALSSDVAIKEQAATVYFGVLPSTIKNLRVVATVGGQQYIGLIRKSCAPAAAKAYSLDVTMTALDNYYVSAAGTGIGESFENAMSLESFLALVETNDDGHVRQTNGDLLDGRKFCFADGTYEVPCFKIEYSSYPTQVAYTLEGGYTSATENEGVTTFNRKDDASQALFTLGNQTDITFRGIVLDGLYKKSDSGTVRAFFPSCGSTSYTTLRIEDCVIKNFNVVSTVDDKTSRGGVLKLGVNATAYLNNVEVFDNVARTRGGAFFLDDASSCLFMNGCKLYNNSLSTVHWGTAIFGVANSIICMNNTTILGAVAAGGGSNTGVISSDSHLLIVNSTIIANTKNYQGAIRSVTDKRTVLVNSLISKGKGPKCFVNKAVVSKGYNAYQEDENNTVFQPDATDTDYSAITLPEATLTNGAYVWTVDPSQTNFATKTAVVDVVKAFGKDKGAFLQWIGEDAFGVDGLGNARNAEKMQPGAYDAGL